MDGRIIDIYTRVTAKNNYFFVPLDNEISLRYFNWVITKIRLENEKHTETGGMIGFKKYSITSNKVVEDVKNYEKSVTHVAIYRKRADDRLTLYRHFMKGSDGTICELEEGTAFTLDDHPLLDKWPSDIKRRTVDHTTSILNNEVEPGAFNIPMNVYQSDKKMNKIKNDKNHNPKND